MNKIIFLFLILGSLGGLIFFPCTLLSWTSIISFVILYSLVAACFTIGYHRLWTHRSFQASSLVQSVLYFFSSAAFPGPLSLWTRAHLLHHDQISKNPSPLSLSQLCQSQMWWTLLSNQSSGVPPPSPSSSLPLPSLDRYYPIVSLLSGLLLPTIIGYAVLGALLPAFLWFGCFRALLQNQVAASLHTLPRLPLGRRPYAAEISVFDSLILAVISLGDGYQNFHHTFPSDFRSGVRKYHWDPSKWLLRLLASLGLVTALTSTSRREWMRARLQTSTKILHEQWKSIDSKLGTVPESQLPVYTWKQIEDMVVNQRKPLVVIDGIVHTVEEFINIHPGGKKIIFSRIGKDATLDFNGAVYRHSKAARNLLGRLRVGKLHPDEPTQVIPDDMKSEST